MSSQREGESHRTTAYGLMKVMEGIASGRAVSPASTEASDGLGPLFNARGCQNCHLKDGRGHPPSETGDERAVSMFLRLSVLLLLHQQHRDVGR